MTFKTRQPTISEAVEIITKQTITREQKFKHMKHWKEKFGQEFHDRVMAELRAKAKK